MAGVPATKTHAFSPEARQRRRTFSQCSRLVYWSASPSGERTASAGALRIHSSATPSDTIHAIQIELSRDLYMDEATFAIKPDGFARVSETLAGLLESLDAFRP